jgi:ElaB/YqjD/DUF883 family membrane-anchored ribosome-binding protein
MDERNKQPSQSAYASTTGRMKDQISEKVSDVKEKVSEFGREAAHKFDESRESAAGALEQTASSLQAGSNKLSGVARTAADKIQSTADYVRETDLRAMLDDFQGLVKRYPGQALAAAAILGFLVARGFRSSD